LVRIQIIGLLGSLLLAVFVLEQVRRRRLAVEYSLVWILACSAMILLALWRKSIDYIAKLMWIMYPPSAVFIVFAIIIIAICIHFSLVISKLSHNNRVLVQKLALLENRFAQINAEHQELLQKDIGAR
jgi:hypothetical protein